MINEKENNSQQTQNKSSDNLVNNDKLYKPTDTISTSINKTVDCNEIISIIGDSKLALVSRNYKKGKWMNSICELGFDGNWSNKGLVIESTKALWEVNAQRDAAIKKQFGEFNLCSETSAKEKTTLLGNVLETISNEDKLSCIDFLNNDNIMPKDFKYVPGVNYKKFVSKMKENYYIDDESIIVITLSTMLSNMMNKGDPVWLLIVAPASGGKTELIRMLTPDGKPNKFAHPVSTLTPNTFISGMEGNEDLLPRLDGKIFTMKDFTTILAKQPDARNDILGQLREIYDGYFSKETGSGVGTKGYSSKITVIAGVTPIVDKYSGVQSLMGERFIRIRQHSESDNKKSIKFRNKITQKAAELDFEEENPVREELSNFILSLLCDFIKATDDYKPKIDKASLIVMQNCAKITSVLRTGIERDYIGDIESIPEPEFGPRLVKTYKKLAVSIAWLLGKEKVDMECFSYIYRISLDTVEKRRIAVLKELDYEPQTTSEIAKNIKLSTKVLYRILEELYVLGLVNKTKMEEEEKEDEDKEDKKGKKSNRGNPWMWSYNEFSPEIKFINITEKYLFKLGGANQHHYNIIK